MENLQGLLCLWILRAQAGLRGVQGRLFFPTRNVASILRFTSKGTESGAAKGPSECSSNIRPSYLKLPDCGTLSPSLRILGKKILRTVLCNVPHYTFILKVGGFPINLTLF